MSNKRKLKFVRQGQETVDLMRSLGLDPKAAPFSGRCIMCGKTLTHEDKDHSICNACFPADMAHLQGVAFDMAVVEADGTGVTVRPVEVPKDPFAEGSHD